MLSLDLDHLVNLYCVLYGKEHQFGRTKEKLQCKEGVKTAILINLRTPEVATRLKKLDTIIASEIYLNFGEK